MSGERFRGLYKVLFCIWIAVLAVSQLLAWNYVEVNHGTAGASLLMSFLMLSFLFEGYLLGGLKGK